MTSLSGSVGKYLNRDEVRKARENLNGRFPVIQIVKTSAVCAVKSIMSAFLKL